MPRLLVLGGTSEASALARALSDRGIDAVFSYAGRTAKPVAQPLPTRVGGFGGVAGLVQYLQTENIRAVIDATHPFAAQMSHNAVAACVQTGTPLTAFQRPAWTPGPQDRWHNVADINAAVAALPRDPARVFLAIGKQNLDAFAAQPQHMYLLRLVDAPQTPLPLPHTQVEIARGPFDVAGDTALLRQHKIQLIIAKNAGGTGAQAKLQAARDLRLEVIMIDRPAVPPRQILARLDDVLAWVAHTAPSARRGV